MNQTYNHKNQLRRWVFTILTLSDGFDCCRSLGIILMIYSYLQPLFMIFPRNLKSVAIFIITFIIRFDLAFIQTTNTVSDTNYLFIFIIHILFKLVFVIVMYKTESANQFCIFKITFQLLTIYQTLFYRIFAIPFSMICIQGILHNNQSLHLIGSIITILLIQLEVLQYFVIYRHTHCYKMNQFDKVKLLKYDYMVYFLKLLQLIIYSMNSYTLLYRQTQQVLLAIISITEIFTQLTQNGVIFVQQQQILHICNGINLIISISYFLNDSFAIDIFTFFILIAPLILDILLKINYNYNQYAFQSPFYSKHIDHDQITYQLIRIINNDDIEEQYAPIRAAFIYIQHRRKCINVLCICRKTYFLNRPIYAHPVNKQMRKQYIQSLIKLIQPEEQTNQTIYAYAMLLYSFDFIVESFKYFNQILRKQDYFPKDQIEYQQGESSVFSVQKSEISSFDLNYKMKFKKESQQLSIIEIFKIQYLISKGKKYIKSTFGSSLLAVKEGYISVLIQQYMSSQRNLEYFQYEIISSIKNKISFYEIIQSKIWDVNSIKKILSQLTHIEQNMIIQYNQQPASQICNCICFYYAEVENNYQKAYNFYNQHGMNSKKMNKFLQYVYQNIGAFPIGHVLVSVQEDLQNLTIESFSMSLLQILGYSESTQLLTFHKLVPQFIQNEHPFLIQRFIESGKSQYYRNFSINFIKRSNHLIQKINFCVDQTLNQAEEKLIFVAFIQCIPEIESYIIFDSQLKLGGISVGFFRQLGYDSDFIESICYSHNLLGIQMAKVFPNFQATEQGSHIGQQLHFIDLKKLDQKNIKQTQLWEMEEFHFVYEVNFMFTTRKLYEFSYHIITFQTITKQRRNQTLIINQAIEKYLKEEQQNFQNSQWRIESEENENQRQMVHQLDIQDMNKYVNQVQDEQLQNSQQQFYKQSSHDNQISNQDPIQNTSQQNINNNNSIKNNHIRKYHSQANSLKGAGIFNRSIHYKQFQLIDNILKYKKYPIGLNALQILVGIKWLILLCYILILLSAYNVDLERFIQEINIISFYAGVMGPHDLFFSIRITLSSYSQLQVLNLITEQQNMDLTKNYYTMIDIGYQELQDSLISILQNPYLQNILDDSQYLVYFKQDENSLQSKQLTLREELMTVLQYQFAYRNNYIAKLSPSGTNQQTFTYANFFHLHEQFQTISLQMNQESKSRANQILQKWNVFFWIFLTTFTLVLSINTYFNNVYHNRLEQFYSLTHFLNDHLLNEQIKRQKHMVRKIEQHSIQLHCFNLEIYFEKQFINLEKIKIEQNISDRKIQLKSNQKKSNRYPCIIYFLFSLVFFLIYSILIQQKMEIYLSKYKTTTDFFKLIQDLKTSSGSIMLYKEIFMRWDNFSFYSDNDRNRLYRLIDNSEQIMTDFIIFTVGIQYTDYLLSDQFINIFKSVQHSNQCNYIDQKFQQLLLPYCEVSFDGALKQGLITSLNYLINSVRTQQAINNFSSRAEYYLFEQEGSQIVTRVFFNLSLQFELGLQEITRSNQSFQFILSIIYIVILVLVFMVLLWSSRNMIQEYNIVKRIISMIPIGTLISHNQLLIQLKLVERQQELGNN